MQQEISRTNPLKSFTDLSAWQQAHQLAKSIYRVTEAFPKTDTYGLAQQMQRAALSVTSNIAEGFGRQTRADTMHFYVMARASITELQNQLILARDIGRIDDSQFDNLSKNASVAIKLLGGLIRSTTKSTSF